MQLTRGMRCSRHRPSRIAGNLALALVCWGCSAKTPDTPAPLSRVARSRAGMVVTGSEPATAAGVQILEAGGNAIDAAVAVGFALAVAEPTQSGLGGRTQVVWRDGQGRVQGLDATTEVPVGFDPASAPGGDYGWSAVAIPGTVAGLAALHRSGGVLAWERVLQPAIRLAEEGFSLSPGEAERLSSASAELATDPGARAHFLKPDGSTYQAGERLVQRALGATLRQLAEGGAEAFYQGPLADVIAREMAAAGGLVTAADLAGYRARPALVGHGRFRDLELWGSYLPASGLTTIEALQILDRVDLSGDVAHWQATLAQALLMAFADREGVTGSPDQIAAEITSQARADRRAAELAGALGLVGAAPGAGVDREHPNTTHVSIVDGAGVAVSLTQSLGPTGGARVASLQLGFLYASTLGYLVDLQPGARPWSSQSPLIVLREGQLAYVLGGAGSRRIISALVSTLVRLGDQGMDLESALAAPRLHPSEDRLTLEVGTGVEGADWAAGDGRESGFVLTTEAFGVYFARLNGIAVDPVTGELLGVGDPRWPWSAAAGPDSW